MDPSPSSASDDISRNASPELDLYAAPGPVIERRITSRTLLSKLKTVKEALRYCDSNHSCKKPDALAMPTRLLNVGREGTNSVSVIVCSEEPELSKSPSVAYAALSYCWGARPALKSNRANLATRKRGFAVSDMPRTLRDAVRVTRYLGLQYLWVDALCILQDCREDWQRESERMGEVYGQAFVTIFAFGARDCERGLFAPADQRALSYWEEPEFRDEPLNHRAWALQEWHLSPRRLIFTSYDLIFDCFQGQRQGFGHSVYDQRLVHTASFGPWDWDDLVLNYSTRELTNPLDKLPAIAGLAQRFDKLSKRPNGRYLSGLWETHLPSSLLWHRMGNSFDRLPEPSLARHIAHRAPSWSWASIDGAVEFAGVGLDVVARVTKIDSRLAVDNDPLGPTAHRLGIVSRMKPLDKSRVCEERAESISAAKKGFTNLLIESHNKHYAEIWGDCTMRPFLEGPNALKFCAIEMESTAPPGMEWGKVWGLLLLEVDQATFKRIGCGWCYAKWFKDAVEVSAEII